MNETPLGVRIVAHQPDGTEVNITDSVMTLYDLVLGAMDWGGGFWAAEDAVPVGLVARACGFDRVDEVERYIEKRRQDEETCAWPRYARGALPHPHVWSSLGKCMWPGCGARESGEAS